MSRFLKAAAAAAVLALSAPAAHAANYVLNLTGDLANLTTSSFFVGPTFYEVGELVLTGFTPLSLVDGDTVEVTVSFTGSSTQFVVPTRDFMYLGLNFKGPVDPVGASANGDISFDGGPNQNVNCGNCASLIYFQNNTPLAFSTLAYTGGFSFRDGNGDPLADPYEVNAVSISYQVNNDPAAVPEPTSWALMITGFGAAGALLRRRRIHGVA